MKFIAENPNFLVFLVGFTVCCASIATYSQALAGLVGGVILMGLAAYPFLTTRKG